jgi:hypothetical protein
MFRVKTSVQRIYLLLFQSFKIVVYHNMEIHETISYSTIFFIYLFVQCIRHKGRSQDSQIRSCITLRLRLNQIYVPLTTQHWITFKLSRKPSEKLSITTKY